MRDDLAGSPGAAHRTPPPAPAESVIADLVEPGTTVPDRGAMLVIVTDDGHLLLHLRDDVDGVVYPGHWSGFGGAVEPGETVDQALRREVLEETGVVVERHVFLAEVVDDACAGRLVSLYYVVGGIAPEDIQLTEGAGIGVHAIEEIDGLLMTPFVRSAIHERLVPILEARKIFS